MAKDFVELGRVMEALLLATSVSETEDCEMTRNANLRDALTAMVKPMVGQIIYTSGGYEQTRVCFYQVVGVTKASVKIHKIAKRYISGENSRSQRGGYYAEVVADRDNFVGEGEMTRRLPRGYASGEYSVKVDYYHGYLWDGSPLHESGDH